MEKERARRKDALRPDVSAKPKVFSTPDLMFIAKLLCFAHVMLDAALDYRRFHKVSIELSSTNIMPSIYFSRTSLIVGVKTSSSRH